jgi:hypothetical protein
MVLAGAAGGLASNWPLVGRGDELTMFRAVLADASCPVDNHLQNAYPKLGVRRRSDLAGALVERT